MRIYIYISNKEIFYKSQTQGKGCSINKLNRHFMRYRIYLGESQRTEKNLIIILTILTPPSPTLTGHNADANSQKICQSFIYFAAGNSSYACEAIFLDFLLPSDKSARSSREQRVVIWSKLGFKFRIESGAAQGRV